MHSLEMEDLVNQRLFLQFTMVDEKSIREISTFINEEKHPIVNKYMSMIANQYQ